MGRLVIVSGSYPNIACGVSRHVDIIARGIVRRGVYETAVLTSRDEAVDAGVAEGYEVYPRIEGWVPINRIIFRAFILILA